MDSDKIVMVPKPFANMLFESEELLALMWAVEVAVEAAADPSNDDIAERAWAVHSRLQAAWGVLVEAIGRKND